MLDVYFSTPMWIKSRGVTYNGGCYHLTDNPNRLRKELKGKRVVDIMYGRQKNVQNPAT